MGRPGDVDDIANAGVYLFSDAAVSMCCHALAFAAQASQTDTCLALGTMQSYITGTRLIVDGGALHGKSAWL